MLRYSKSRDDIRYRSGTQSSLNSEIDQTPIASNNIESSEDSSTHSFIQHIYQINLLMNEISKVLLSFDIQNIDFNILYQKYRQLAAKLVQTGVMSLDKQGSDMKLKLIKQIKKQQKKRKKLEKDLDNLFQGARMAISEKQNIIKNLEQKILKIQQQMNKRQRQLKQQMQIIDLLKNKLDSQEPISKYLPSIPITQQKQLKTSRVSTKSEQSLKPPLPSPVHAKNRNFQLQSDSRNINFSPQFSSDLMRMLLIQASSLQAKLQSQQQKYLI